MPVKTVPLSLLSFLRGAARTSLTACTVLSALPSAAQAQQPRPGAVADTVLSNCSAANRQTMAELMQELQASTRRNVASPMTISRLQGVDANLRKLRDALGRSSRNLPDCEQMALDLAGEHERLARITGAAPPAAAGTGDSGAMAVGAVLAAVPAPAAVAAAAAPAAAAASAGSRVSAAVASMPAPTPAPPPSDPACRDTAARTYNELAQVYTGLTQPERLRPEWQLPLKTLGERLTRLHASIARVPGAAAWDCALVTQGLAQSRADLAVLAPQP